jgi:hypothetical protein
VFRRLGLTATLRPIMALHEPQEKIGDKIAGVTRNGKHIVKANLLQPPRDCPPLM